MKTALPSRQRALQAVLLFALLLGIAVLVYGGQVGQSGFIGDAWLTRGWYALYPHAGFFHTVGHFLNLDSVSPRPANAVFRVALNDWFGGNTEAWLIWQLVSCVCMCFAVYLLLREIGASFLDAAAVSGLLLVLPVTTSLWLWSALAHASLAIALGALGFLLALRALGSEGRRRWVLHGASLLLFVISILLYEVCLPVFLASVLLYSLRGPRRAAIARWLVDCAVLLPIALTVTDATKARDQTLGGSISHAGEMAGQLPSLLFGRLLPLGSARALAAIALAAVYAAGIVAIRRLPAAHPVRDRLRFLFALTGSGIVVIVLGYLIYVPGIDYYVPLSRGIGDRVNALAGIGWVLCLYALAAMIATLATIGLRRRAPAAALGTAALTIALGISWLAPIADESRAYVAANREDHRVLRVLRRAIPNPPRGAAIWTFEQPVETAYGVPVFANYWNMTAAAALALDDRGVRSFVALPGTRFECLKIGVVPIQDPEYPPPGPGKLGEFGSRYGRTYFVGTERGQITTIDSRAECLRQRRVYPLSPELPPGA